MTANEEDPSKSGFVLNQEPKSDEKINYWISNLQKKAAEGDEYGNKANKENPILKQEIKLTPTLQKNRTKYFKSYPKINLMKDCFIPRNKNIKLFLQNGNQFQTAHKIHGRSILLKNTCPFVSVIQILSIGALENEKYLNHIEASENETLGFILVFLELGGTSQVYIQRCLLLMNFINTEEHQRNDNFFYSNSSSQLRIINVESNIVNMWKYLMIGELSARRYKKCSLGHQEIKEIPVLNINETLIKAGSFKAFEISILIPLENETAKCKYFNTLVKEEVALHVHLFVELDIRTENNLSLSCKPTDFPTLIALKREEFRLTGLVIYLPNHYMALCRRTNNRWEIRIDLLKGKIVIHPRKKVTSHAAIPYQNLEESNSYNEE